jgi:hypothetical protein
MADDDGGVLGGVAGTRGDGRSSRHRVGMGAVTGCHVTRKTVK